MKLKLRTRQVKKRWILLGAAGVIVLLLTSYAAASAWAWSHYQGSYTDQRSAVKSKLDSALALPQQTADERTKWLAAVQAAAQSATARPNCTMSRLYAWQQKVISSLKQRAADCIASGQKLTALSTQITGVIQSAQAEEQLTAILQPLLGVKTVNEADYGAQQASWAAAATALSKIDVPPELTGVRNQIVAGAQAIETAWKAVATADASQNVSGYQTALAGLSQAYKGINTTANQSTQTFQTLGKSLQQAYAAAFS